jgi:hypothetical protein
MDAQRIIDQLSDTNPEAVFFDNMHHALVGIGRIAGADPVAIYSKAKIYAKLFSDGLSVEDANEYFSGRFLALRAGEHTPVILDDMEEV